MALPSVAELSLFGLLARLTEVERLKEIKSLDDEQEAVLVSEAAAKKAVAEELQAASSGITSWEKKRAKEFLDAQVKAIEEGSKGAEARRSKLRELLAGIEAAPSKEDPAHVRRAKLDVAKAEKAFEEVSKSYERWKSGKKMLSVDEIKAVTRSYEEGKQKLEKARTLVEKQQSLKPQSAAAPVTEEKERGSAAVAIEARAGRGRGKATGRGAPAPAVSMRAAAAAGYAVAPGGYSAPQPSAPSANAMRQAQMAAQVRQEAEEAAHAAPAPRPRPVPRAKQPEEGPVLSYACTCTAVAEHLGIKEAQARDMADSAKDFAQHFEPETWDLIRERSVAIEKANREKQREAEKRKQAAALAKVTEQESSTHAVGGPPAKAAPKPAPKTAAAKVAGGYSAPKAKPKAKSNAGLKTLSRPEGIQSMAGANKFAGLDDDSDDGFTVVRR